MNSLFQTKVWMRNLGMWLGLCALVYGCLLVWDGEASAWWLLASYLITYWATLCISVGHHRLFSHSAFSCHRLWHYVFAIQGAAFLNSSPIQWAYVHLGHHRYSDTAEDPHETRIGYFFRYKHKPTPFPLQTSVMRLLKDPMHSFVHKYSALIFLAAAAVSYSISWYFFIFCFMIPMGYNLLSVGMFLVYSHRNGKAANQFWAEFIFPFAGEWVHTAHHEENPKLLNNAVKPWEIDMGYQFIQVVRNDYVQR
jgi:sn-1 stearoyl-lipid 9-desaturase